MVDFTSLIRTNIRTLTPYSCAREEYSGTAQIFLDANESPYGEWNRYPDPYQKAVKEKIAAYRGVNTDQVFVGNGSDEVIDLLFRVFCEPGKDAVLGFSPSYGMYQVTAQINNVDYVTCPLNSDFSLNMEEIDRQLKNPNLKLIFLCTPNNPTGNCFDVENVRHILEQFSGLVVIDEAYVDFSSQSSWVQQLNAFSNMVVLQTLSKAWGLAGARVGFGFAHPDLVAVLNQVKPPYNVGSLSQRAALETLDKVDRFKKQTREALQQREELGQFLSGLAFVEKVYPSEANFLLVQFQNPNKVREKLVENGIIVRDRAQLIDRCLRISIGSLAENIALKNTLMTLL